MVSMTLRTMDMLAVAGMRFHNTSSDSGQRRIVTADHQEQDTDMDSVHDDPPANPPGDAGGWLNRLVSCPRVSLLEAHATSARIEFAGIEGRAAQTPGGLCIALRLQVGAPVWEWVVETTLALGAVASACDDTLTRKDGEWFLWRRYDHGLDPTELDKRVEMQAAFAALLAETAVPVRATDGTDLGRWI